MDEWYRRDFEVRASEPKEGETALYAAIHILRLRELNIPFDKVALWLREPEKGGERDVSRR